MRQAQRLLAATAATIAAALMLTGAAGASGTLDQASTTPNGGGSLLNSSVTKAAQTFTAGLTGPLTTADLSLGHAFNACDPNLDPTLTLETVSSGIPTGTVLAQTTIPESSITATGGSTQFVSVDFPTPATVNAGTEYALVLSTAGAHDCPGIPITQGGYIWGESTSYAGGGSATFLPGYCWCETGDRLFRTYVLTYEAQTLQPPSRTYRPGDRVEVMFRLTLTGVPLTKQEGQQLAASCGVQIGFSGGGAGPWCAKWDKRKGAFYFKLPLPKSLKPGTYDITAGVSGASVPIATITVA